MRILDKHATLRMEDDGFDARPEVNRRSLRDLFPRSEASAAMSIANLGVLLRSDAPQGLIDLMAQYAAGGAGA